MASGKMFQSVKQPLPVRRRGVRQGKAALPPPKNDFCRVGEKWLQRQRSLSGENLHFVRNEGTR